MRRREKYALDTKISDPLAYETTHRHYETRKEETERHQSMGRGRVWTGLEDKRAELAPKDLVKKVSGVCGKCGKYIGRGRAFHERWCGTQQERKALGHGE